MQLKVMGLVLAAAIAVPAVVRAERPAPIVPPPMPGDLALSPDEFVPFFVGHAVGTQGYFCVVAGGAYKWTPFGPQATLFDADGNQVMTHFLSPAPYSLLPSPAWQHSRDTSVVWGSVLKTSTDANYVAADAIPWLLLEASVVGDGPTGGGRLLQVRRIQRLNTVEGKAPASGCAAPNDIGKRALVSYEADYYFYKDAPGKHSGND